MSVFQQSQTVDSSKLALPDGLKELMADISREVLRAQPTNPYDFITKYLAALLVTRENMAIGYRLCRDVCDSSYLPELEDELKNIGLDEEDAVIAKEIIEKYLNKGKVNEGNLMMRLMRKTSIPEDLLELVQEAVRNAFLHHQIHVSHHDGTDIPKMSQEKDEVSRAAYHTLQLYAETGPSKEEYNQKASRIQAAYRAYGVRRLSKSKSVQETKGKSLRFRARSSSVSIDVDVSSDPSQADLSKSSSVLYYDPRKCKETDESSSRINSSEISEPKNSQPCIKYGKKREQSYPSEHRKLRLPKTKEIHNMMPALSSFEARKTHSSSLLYEKSSKSAVDNESNGNSKDDDEISSIYEVNFREFCEKSSNEAVYEAESLIGEISIDDIVVDETKTVYDNALNADNDSDVPKEENIGKNI